jgi:hypothetical protein
MSAQRIKLTASEACCGCCRANTCAYRAYLSHIQPEWLAQQVDDVLGDMWGTLDIVTHEDRELDRAAAAGWPTQ